MKEKRSGLYFLMLLFLIVAAVVYLNKLVKPPEELTHEVKEDDPIFDEEPLVAPVHPTRSNLAQLNGEEDVKRYLYTIDETAYVDSKLLDVWAYAKQDMTVDFASGEPKVLIFHTHSSEDFIDSRPGVQEDTIVGIGQVLSELLADKYNISVVHDMGRYDVTNGNEERLGSYERMEPAVMGLLEKYPSVEIVIDMHRDGVPDDVHLVTDINGKPTARLMLFNGSTVLNKGGKPKDTELYNPYLKDNMALSLNMQLNANELYPGLMRNIYIKPYRYSLHMKPKSILVEVGANTNTVEEVRNAMEPLAEIIYKTFTGIKG